MSPAITLITTSYNQLGTLKLLLASLERQTFRDFEVLVADDGSSDGTAAFCADYRDLPLRFVTQEDQGYRKARILNEAIHSASADYLIFVDSDVVVGERFVEDHLWLRRPDSFVCGRRVDLGPKITAEVTRDSVLRGELDRPSLRVLMSSIQGETQNLKRGIRVPFQFLRKVLRYDRPIDILGSNLSLWKSDLIAINGFNEALESYWGEDGDLFIRLRNAGKRALSAKGLCIQYHLFHKRREASPENVRFVTELLKNTEYRWAERGYSSRFSR